MPAAPPVARFLRRALIRSPHLRRSLVAVVPRLRAKRYDLAHLALVPEEDAYGPLQRDEALLLYGLVRTTRPAVIVEMGFFIGDSALNFLQALPPTSRVHSFDIADHATGYAAMFPHPNFTYHRKSQDEITPGDVGHASVDLVFLDASHDLELNRRTFERLQEVVSDDAIIVVHDTGTWHPSMIYHQDWAARYPERRVSDQEYLHEPDERAFVNWVRETYPEYAQIHLHTTRVLRHGLTLLQRSRRLSVPGERPDAAARTT